VTSLGLAKPQPHPETKDGGRATTPTLEAVYRAHSATVARWAKRLLGPKDDYEDVVHEVFLVVQRRLPEFRGDAQITTWLHEITVRMVQTHRRRARWWSWVKGLSQNPSRGSAAGLSTSWFEPVADPEATLEARERARLLYSLLDELREDLRTTFILFELEGLSGNQIAEITGTNLTTVWVRLSRARRKFLERMRTLEARAKP
jgi:RNA polymerase sigma-70 factor, ECF subfamily